MAKKMTKAEMEAFKKKNFDKSKKVTEAQLDKLRKEGTPAKAIAKYKNDPAMREALNRFYGKDRVSKTAGSAPSSSTSSQRGGPGARMPKRPAGGPGAKMTTRDGRGATASKPNTSKTSAASGSKSNAKKVDDAVRWIYKNVGPDKVLSVTGVGGGAVKLISVAKNTNKGKSIVIRQDAAKAVADRATAKANAALAAQKSAVAAKNAAKTGPGSGAGSASRAAKLQREAAAAKKAAGILTREARSANARTRSMGTSPVAKTSPKSRTASPKAPVSGTAKQADDMLMNMKGLAKKKSVRRTAYVAGGAAYLSRPRRDERE